MVAGSANCALGGRASSASLAVSVCQCHLGRTALRTYSTSPQLRGHRHAHMHGCTQESKGRHALHIYVESTNMHGMNSAHTYEGTHTHRHSRPLTAHHLCAASDFSLCFVLCPCFCFHKRAVPFLLSTLSLIVPRLIR